MAYSTRHNKDEVEEHHKVLGSDIDDRRALNLLKKWRATREPYNVFTDEDLSLLVKCLSILKVPDNEVIIIKGEEASFIAFILDGEVEVKINDNIKFLEGVGTVFGEMALFGSNNTRSADISCKAPSIVAVISFAEIEQLVYIAPELYSKLFHILASIAMLRLREQMTARLQEAGAGKLSAPPSPSVDLKTVLGHRKSVIGITMDVSHESLYKRRKVATSDVVITTEKTRRTQAEHKLTNLKLLFERVKAKKNMLEAETSSQKRILGEWTRKIEKLENQTKKQKSKILSLQESSKKAKDNLEKKIKVERLINSTLKDELRNVREQFDVHHKSVKGELERRVKYGKDRKHSLFQKYSSEKEELKSNVASLSEFNESLLKDLHVNKAANEQNSAKIEGMQNYINVLESKVAKLAVESSQLQRQRVMQDSKFDDLSRIKRRQADIMSDMETERARLVAVRKNLLNVNAATQSDLISYRRLLKYMTVSSFVKNWRIKQLLKSAVRKVGGLQKTLLAAQLQSNKYSRSVQLESENELGNRIKQREKALRSICSSEMILKLVNSVETEVNHLCPLVDKLKISSHYWKATAESFFARNVELTNHALTHECALEDAHKKINEQGVQYKILLKEHDLFKRALMQKHKKQREQHRGGLPISVSRRGSASGSPLKLPNLAASGSLTISASASASISTSSSSSTSASSSSSSTSTEELGGRAPPQPQSTLSSPPHKTSSYADFQTPPGSASSHRQRSHSPHPPQGSQTARPYTTHGQRNRRGHYISNSSGVVSGREGQDSEGGGLPRHSPQPVSAQKTYSNFWKDGDEDPYEKRQRLKEKYNQLQRKDKEKHKHKQRQKQKQRQKDKDKDNFKDKGKQASPRRAKKSDKSASSSSSSSPSSSSSSSSSSSPSRSHVSAGGEVKSKSPQQPTKGVAGKVSSPYSQHQALIAHR